MNIGEHAKSSDDRVFDADTKRETQLRWASEEEVGVRGTRWTQPGYPSWPM